MLVTSDADGLIYGETNATFHDTSDFDMQSEASLTTIGSSVILNEGTITKSSAGTKTMRATSK